MKKLNDVQLRALKYVRNTGFSATVAQFDDDHDPIGPALRSELMPKYMAIHSDGRLGLTTAGEEVSDGA